ncbi:Transcriptional regulator, DeoR family [Rubellimicrobium mesophilum DSM 19309]|uniref:Transcriptional regulator, DeoR family n=1 Tax=Rubellimicrobium mesophilum DSM 19309 TaxID=442562 RepID=A0A017HLF7_9RHOB|nr:YafY family protein [Rubellimicrobium mesophilum]EYD75191.1 Transcriptional regulator, DeoR family [Rubellimicrobium mesophilum DSM 19309]
MPRSDRLFRLLHALRSLPAPVTAARLAEATEVSVRSIYRDIAALRAAGARIDGEAGYGYALEEDPALPPQSFTRMEIEALLLGLGEVRQSGDAELAQAAESVAAKVIARLPERQAREAAHAVLRVYRHSPRAVPQAALSLLRESAWEERAVDLAYRDEAGQVTRRRVWPLAVAYLDEVLLMVAWCCLRQGFRRFRLDRIESAEPTEESFRPRRVSLLRDYVVSLR